MRLGQYISSIGPFLLVSFLFSCTIIPRNRTIPAIWSTYVNDSFEIYLDLPDGYNPHDSNYTVVYYMDANLNLGYQLRHESYRSVYAGALGKVIFVGVGHMGDYALKRNRDFIPPPFKNGQVYQTKTAYRNHADLFYYFLSKELIPYVDSLYPNNCNKTYIGHSLSGLFGIYALFRKESMFRQYVIMSPSLWVNRNNFFQFEKDFHSGKPSIKATVYYFCGKGEWGNEILPTSRKLKKILENDPYTDLEFHYTEQVGKDHYEVVPVTLEWVFANVTL